MNKYKVRLKTLSNLHIGDGNILQSFDYIRRGNQYHIIDQDKFVDKIIQKDLADSFIRYINNQLNNKDRNIEKFCVQNKIGTGSITKYTIEGIDHKNITNIETFIKNSHNQPYIPGSSIKGFISNVLGIDPKKQLDEVKTFRVSDSKPISAETLFVSTPSHFNIEKKFPRNGQMNLVEFIGRGAEFEFDLWLDDDITKSKLQKSILNLNQHYYANFISKFCVDGISVNDNIKVPDDNGNEYNIKLFKINDYFRLGKYTNFLLKTSNYMKKYRDVKELVGKTMLKFSRQSHNISIKNEIAPITIKMSECKDGIFRENGVCCIESFEKCD